MDGTLVAQSALIAHGKHVHGDRLLARPCVSNQQAGIQIDAGRRSDAGKYERGCRMPRGSIRADEPHASTISGCCRQNTVSGLN